jgi:putative ABC transport system permease protein
MVRWAWRLFRREWRQQLLVLALTTVAVAAALVGAAIGSQTPQSASATFGSADHLVTLPGTDPRLAADIAAIRARFGTVDVIDAGNIDTGSARRAQVRAQDPTGPYGRATLALRSGRYPAGSGQIAVTSQLASRYHLSVGEVWATAPGGPKQVVGLVENPQNLLDTFALVPAGQLSAPAQVTVLFDADSAQAAAFAFPTGAVAQTRPPPAAGLTREAVVLVVATFGLIFIGLVSAAGFSVMAQRRLRALGMVGSLGATDRNIRLVMVANGAIVGLVAAVIGAAIGLATWFAYAPHLQTSANHVVDALDLPWWLIGTCMGLAVVTTTLAARGPAGAVARIPVVAALSGRPTPPRPTRRSAVPGIVLVAAGLLLLAVAGPGTGAARNMPFLLLGIVMTVLGGLLFSPFAITVLATAARHTPVAARLALRDLARYRSRSSAALGAVTLAVTIAVMLSAVASTRSANVLDYVGPNLGANQLVVNGPPPRGPGVPDKAAVRAGVQPAAPGLPPGPALTPAQVQNRAGAIASAVGARDVLGLILAPVTLYRTTDPQFQNFNGAIEVATPELLAHYGMGPGDIEPGADILTSRPGLDSVAHLQLIGDPVPVADGSGPEQGPPPAPGSIDALAASCPPATCVAHPRIQETNRLPTGTDAPNVVITEHGLQRLGLQAGQPDRWLVETPRALTATQKDTAEAVAAAAGLTVDTKSAQPSLSALETGATAAGILLGLGVLAMTSGLIRSETAGDLRTLTATGASSRVRRAITAVTAGGLGLLGGLIGVAIGLAGLSAFYRRHLHDLFARLPVVDLLVLLIGLPLAAAVGGWLFAGRQPAAIAHQPLD